MSTVAELGLAINATPADKAAESLSNLADSADRVESSFENVERAASTGGASNTAYAKTLSEAYGASSQFTSAQIKVIRSLEDLIAQTQVSGQELAAYIALRAAGTNADTDAGKAIIALTNAYSALAEQTEIAALRARQAGSEFQRSLNESFRIGASATSGGATFSALAEQAKKLDEIDSARAKHNADVAQSFYNQVLGINRATKSAKESASVFAELDSVQQRTGRSASDLANTLTRRFTVGFLVSQISGLVSYLASLNKELVDTTYLGKLTGIGSQRIQDFEVIAGYSGIAAAEFNAAMVNFNQQIPLAKAGIGSLGELFRAYNITVTDTEDAFLKIADLIKRAGNETEKLSILQQAWLPATRQQVDLMTRIRDLTRDQYDDVSKITDHQLREADILEKRWLRFWTDFVRWAKRSIVDVSDELSKLDEKIGKFYLAVNPSLLKASALMINKNKTPMSKGEADNFYDSVDGPWRGEPTRITLNRDTVDRATQNRIDRERISREQQYLGLLGQTTTASEARRQVELQLQMAVLNGIGIDEDRADTLKRLAEENALGITSIKAQVDAYRLEAETLGMSTAAAEAYRLVQEKINEAKRNGGSLSEPDRSRLEAEAQAAGAAKQSLEQQKFAFDTYKGLFSDFRSGLMDGVKLWDSLGKAGVNALNKISEKLMNSALDSAWNMLFPKGGAAGGTSIFSSIFSMFGFDNGGVMTSRGPLPLNRYESGGVANRPQVAMFGEGRTPEAYVPLPDGRSIPVSIDVPRVASPPIQPSRSDVNIVVENHANGVIFEAERMTDDRVRIIAREEASVAVHKETEQVIASKVASPNSRLSKAFRNNMNVERRR